MAGLDPRFDPPRDEDDGGFDFEPMSRRLLHEHGDTLRRLGDMPEQRTVDKAFLDELYATAATAKLMRGYLEALDRDPEFRCSIGGFDAWVIENHG